MARIPTIVAERSLDTAANTQPRNFREDDSNTRALSAVGSALMRTGQQFDNVADRLQAQQEALETFQTEQQFNQLSSRLDQTMTERQRTAPPGASKFTEQFTKNDMEPEVGKFLETVPERLKPRYEARLGAFREVATNKASNVEYDLRSNYYKTTIEKDSGRIAADVHGNPDGLSAARDHLYQQIDTATITPTEREAMKSRHGLVIATAAIQGLIKQKRHDEARGLAGAIAGTIPDMPGAVDTDGARGIARQAIIKAATDQGFDPQTAVMVAHLESSLNPDAANPKSTARGLFQFREKERKDRGIPDKADMDVQATQGVAWLKEKTAELNAAGLEVTPFTLYMAHFQGTNGAKKILTAQPDAPLKATLDQARPGWKDKDGKSYGEAVMAANNIRENTTVGDFRATVARKVSGGMIAAGAADLGWGERKALVDKTETAIRTNERETQRDMRDEVRKVQRLVSDDLFSVVNSGVEDARLSESRVSDTLGPDAAAQWLGQREISRRYHASTKDFSILPTADIQARLSEIGAEAEGLAGKDNYQVAVQLHGEAQKKAAAVMKERNADPARAVAGIGFVQEAAAVADPARPETIRELGQRRVEAQRHLGVPITDRSPITMAEAEGYANTLGAVKGGADIKVATNSVVSALERNYGPNLAPLAMATILKKYKIDTDVSVQLYSMMKKQGEGVPLTAADHEKLRFAEDFAVTAKAHEWEKGRITRSADPPPAPGKYIIGGPNSPDVSAADITALRTGGMTAEEFDKRYDKGAAEAHLAGRAKLSPGKS